MAHPDFEELLAEFNAERVRYLIGGAHAVALHARPRASKDIDIFIDPTRANATRAVTALKRFFSGTAPRYVTVDALMDPDSILQLGVAPVRVNLLSHFATSSFRQAWNRRHVARFGNVSASYIGLEDLIAEKAHWSRPQDLADLVVLLRARDKPRGKGSPPHAGSNLGSSKKRHSKASPSAKRRALK